MGDMEFLCKGQVGDMEPLCKGQMGDMEFLCKGQVGDMESPCKGQVGDGSFTMEPLYKGQGGEVVSGKKLLLHEEAGSIMSARSCSFMKRQAPSCLLEAAPS